MAITKLDVKELLKAATQLPPLPAVALEIVKVANDPHTAAEDLSKILAVDQSLSAKVLRLVNSSYYGVKNRVASVKQAVVILGFETVRSIALSTAIMDKFAAGDSLATEIRTQFWRHSLGVAMTNRVLARHLHKSAEEQEAYYMAGLLHDIGKVILDQYFNENFTEIMRHLQADRELSFYECERRLQGVSHDEIGAFLGAQWKLPNDIIAAIRYHHEPLAAPAAHAIVDATHFANILTKIKGMGSGGDEIIAGLNEQAVARLGIAEAEVGVIVDVEITREFEGAAELLKLLG